MSKKKGAKGMPREGPGKHDPSKPVKRSRVDPGFIEAARTRRYEGHRKTRL
jgi:hypothetical protein